MLIAAVSCHAGANMSNDYFDHRKGVDNERNLGPHKVIQLGLLTETQVRNGMIAAFERPHVRSQRPPELRAILD